MTRQLIPGFDYRTGNELSLHACDWARRVREALAQGGRKGRDSDGVRWAKDKNGNKLFEFYEDGQPATVKGERVPPRARETSCLVAFPRSNTHTSSISSNGGCE